MRDIPDINWNDLKAEYISTEISQRALAAKYGVTYATVRHRAEMEDWVKGREEVKRTVTRRTAQKVAQAATDNVAIAERIRKTLLLKLEREVNALPDDIGSTTQDAKIENIYDNKHSKKLKRIEEKRKEYSLRDLTTAYRNLTADMPKSPESSTMSKLDELLKEGWDAAINSETS